MRVGSLGDGEEAGMAAMKAAIAYAFALLGVPRG